MKFQFLRLCAGILIVLCAPTCVPRVRAQGLAQNATRDASGTSKIGRISVVGTRKISGDQVIVASGLHLGDVVSAEQIQAAANRLTALGVLSKVNYRFTSERDGIVLEFTVEEAPTVPVLFDDFPWFADDEIVAAVRNAVGLFVGEAPESGALLDGITAVLQDMLSSRKIKGTVKHQLTARPIGNGMIMEFLLEGGDVVKVHSIEFGDPLAADSERLKDRLSDLRGQPYSRFAIEIFEEEQLRPLYAAKGFLRAQIGPPQSRVARNPDDSGQPVYVPGGGAGDDFARLGVDVLIPITLGDAYAWSGASWQGNAVLASTVLDGATGMKSGGVADGTKIAAAWQNVESAYGKIGYLDAKVDAQPDFDDVAHRVSYRVQIVEGPQYTMGQLVITGLSLDAENRVQQVWKTKPGQVFDNTYFETFLKTIAKPTPQIFGDMPIHYTQCGHWLRPDTGKHTVDVLLDFK